jgi:hypothetical protein
MADEDIRVNERYASFTDYQNWIISKQREKLLILNQQLRNVKSDQWHGWLAAAGMFAVCMLMLWKWPK